MSTSGKTGRKSRRGIAIVAGILVLAAIVTGAVILINDSVQTSGLMEGTVIVQGVSVGGVKVSGLTKEEAVSATAGLQDEFLSKVEVTLSVNGENTKFTAKDLGLATDYNDAIDQAFNYGHTGTLEERKAAADKARTEGVDFPLHASGTKETIAAALATLKQKVDKPAVDATAVFTPSGHTADGQPYTPDPKALADAHSKGKDLTHPELARIDTADTPNPLRYKYYENSKYIKDYIPPDATISRFVYTPDAPGSTLDVNAAADQILAALSGGDLAAPITVALQPTEAAIKLADIKKATQLVASWSSSFGGASHYGTNRNWNVSRMSSFINGNVIEPGGQFSVNKVAGPRNDSTARSIGWKKAAGLENGGTTQQVGGGVCQLGSTTYNAAIRAGLTIASSTHHTIPSDYVPLGLDATLSTPAPDLVLQNDNTMPVYIVSYVNPKERNVTVEIYGQTVVDPTYGDVILDFTNGSISSYGTPVAKSVYGVPPITPDDHVFTYLGESYEYSKNRAGKSVETFKIILSPGGNQLSKTSLGTYRYPVINGTTYINLSGPDASIPPTGSPTTSPSTPPTATPTPTPSPTTSTTPTP